MGFLRHLELNKGVKFALAVNKETRLSVLRYLSGGFYSSDFVRLTYDGFPIRLRSWKRFLQDGNIRNFRILLSVLSVTRRVRLPVEYNYTALIEPYKGIYLDFGPLTDDFVDYLRHLSYRKQSSYLFRKGKPILKDWSSFHMTSKAGPSGPALSQCLEDLVSLPDSLRLSIAVLGGKALKERMVICHHNYSLLSNELHSSDRPNPKRKG